MDVSSLESLFPLAKSVAGSIGAVAADDIAVLTSVLWGIVEYTKQNIPKNGELENRALPRIVKGMAVNRLAVGTGLCAAFAAASCFLPAAMPVITGVLCLGAGGVFALKCSKEYHEMAGKAASKLHKHESLPQYAKGLLKKLFPHHETEANTAKDLPECAASEKKVVDDVVKEAVSIDRGLTVELSLVAALYAMSNPQFSSVVTSANGDLLQTFLAFAIPTGAAAAVTLGVVTAGATIFAKSDNFGYSCNQLTAEKIRGKISDTASRLHLDKLIAWTPKAAAFSKTSAISALFDKALDVAAGVTATVMKNTGLAVVTGCKPMGKVIQPSGITLLMGIAGKMVIEGAEIFAPALEESLPHVLMTEPGEIAAGIAIGGTLLGLEITANHLKKLVSTDAKQKAQLQAEMAGSRTTPTRLTPDPAPAAENAIQLWTRAKGAQLGRQPSPVRKATTKVLPNGQLRKQSPKPGATPYRPITKQKPYLRKYTK